MRKKPTFFINKVFKIRQELIVSEFSRLVEFERELILQRQREGIQIAKAAGK